MSDHTLVHVQQLSRRFGQVQAVDRLDLQLRRGEILGLLGPNGAGKSTTLKMLAGVLRADRGEILIDGIDLQQHPARAKARIGYLPELPPLYSELRVNEYLRYCAHLHGLTGPDVDAALVLACERCGLSEVRQRLIRNLSKGYQQRVGIAQAILHQPEIVILDEPTVGLDPIQIREIRTLIRAIGNDHSLILSTHILPEVQAVCDRVMVIHHGRVVLNTPLSELNDREQRLRIGLARPPALHTLRDLPGVERLVEHPQQQFSLYLQAAAIDAEQLAKMAVQQDWGLFLLRQEQASLEETFVRLTCGDSEDDRHDTAGAQGYGS